GPRSPTPPVDERSIDPTDGKATVPRRKSDNRHRHYDMQGERPATLEPVQSAALRQKLLNALEDITSADSATVWAREALAAKNRLAADDAKLVETAFEHKLSELPSSETAQAAGDAAPTILVDIAETQEIRTTENGIDKSQLAIATPRRRRSREHLRFVAQQACLVCGRKQSDPHHLRYLQPRALGRKVSDEFAVPL